jgi:tetratricopeptide (TPR) repeat protein
MCRGLLTAAPNQLEAEFALAAIAYGRGDPELALDQIGKVLIRDPAVFPALTLAARIFFETGKPQRGLELAHIAHDQQPRDVAILLMIGRCLAALGKALEALQAFDAAISLEPGQPAGYFGRANAFLQLGISFDAAEDFWRGLALAPNNNAELAKLGTLELSMGRPAQALDAARRIIANDPTNPSGNMLAGRSLTESGSDESADSYWQAARAVKGDEWRVERQRAYALSMSGRFEDSEACLERSISLEPRQGGAYQLLFACRKVNDDDRKRIEWMEALAERQDLEPDESAPLEFALGKAWDGLGDPQRAIGHFDRANAIRRRTLEATRPFSSAKLGDQFALHRELFSSTIAPQKGPANGRPIFVVGMMRSGTTLVEQILASHSEVVGAGEQDFWPGSEKLLVDSDRRCLRPELIPGRREAYLRLLASIGEGAARVVDKNPANLLSAGLIHHIFPNSPIIHLRREPIDTAVSIWMTDASAPFIADRENIVFAIREEIRQADHWLKVLPPNRFLDVKYEDLVADPEASIRRILEFCDLPWQDACLHPSEISTTVKTPSLWQVRQPIYQSSVAKWKRYEPWLREFRELLSPT